MFKALDEYTLDQPMLPSGEAPYPNGHPERRTRPATTSLVLNDLEPLPVCITSTASEDALQLTIGSLQPHAQNPPDAPSPSTFGCRPRWRFGWPNRNFTRV